MNSYNSQSYIHILYIHPVACIFLFLLLFSLGTHAYGTFMISIYLSKFTGSQQGVILFILAISSPITTDIKLPNCTLELKKVPSHHFISSLTVAHCISLIITLITIFLSCINLTDFHLFFTLIFFLWNTFISFLFLNHLSLSMWLYLFGPWTFQPCWSCKWFFFCRRSL